MQFNTFQLFFIVCRQNVSKYIIQRFLKNLYSDSTMYPHEVEILDAVEAYFSSRSGESLQINPQLLKIRLNLRLQRNKISHTVINAYDNYTELRGAKKISISGILAASNTFSYVKDYYLIYF